MRGRGADEPEPMLNIFPGGGALKTGGAAAAPLVKLIEGAPVGALKLKPVVAEILTNDINITIILKWNKNKYSPGFGDVDDEPN